MKFPNKLLSQSLCHRMPPSGTGSAVVAGLFGIPFATWCYERRRSNVDTKLALIRETSGDRRATAAATSAAGRILSGWERGKSRHCDFWQRRRLLRECRVTKRDRCLPRSVAGDRE